MDSTQKDWILFALTGDPAQYLKYKKKQQQEEENVPSAHFSNM